MEPENPALDDYVLGRCRRRAMPKICLLPTASGDGEAQIRQFHATFGSRACEPMHISLFRLGSRPIPLRETLLDAGRDLRRRRLDARAARRLARARPRRDPARVLGVGRRARRPVARARCAGSSGASRARWARRRRRPGLGFLPGSMSVHMDGEPARLPVCRAAIADGTIPPGYAADDGVALLFRGTELEEVVSSRPEPPRAAARARTARSGARAAPARASRTASARRPRSPSSAACGRSARPPPGARRAALAPLRRRPRARARPRLTARPGENRVRRWRVRRRGRGRP